MSTITYTVYKYVREHHPITNQLHGARQHQVETLALKPSGNYIPQLSLTNCNTIFYICGLCMVLTVNSDYFLNSINQLILLMVRYGVLFEVRT
jgi:hypothetical protein